MKKLMNRALSIVLAVTMCVGLLSLSAFAAEPKCPKCGDTVVAEKGGYVCYTCNDYATPTFDDETQKPEDNKDGGEDKKDPSKPQYCTGGNHVIDSTGKCKYCDYVEEEVKQPEPGKPDHPAWDLHECTFGGWIYGDNDTHFRTCTNVQGTCPLMSSNCQEWGNCAYEKDSRGIEVCGVCGHEKSPVELTPGGDDSKYCKDGQHVFGNTYQRGEGSHRQTCMNCPYTTDWEGCNWGLEYKDESNVVIAQVCSVCGNTKSVNDVPVCDKNDPAKGHDWKVDRTELATDGKTKLTIVKCANCGAEKVDGKCNAQEDEFLLTINYVYENGKEAYPSVIGTYAKGDTYRVESSKLEGYTADIEVVQGTMPGEDHTVTVTYKANKYKLTINYVYDDNGGVFHTVEGDYAYGEEYSVTSVPAPAGYELAAKGVDEVKSGTMPSHDLELTVSYKPVTYTWTINYVDENGKAMEGMQSFTKTFTVNDRKNLEAVTSPTKEGYTADQPVVNAPTELKDVTVNVVYTLSASYKLVVNHEYVALNGTRTVVTQTIGENYKMGDSYTTSPAARSGYTLSATPANANGVFGAEDVIVTYVYNADDEEPTPPEEENNDPEPTPEPPVDINEPEVPLIEEPEVDIEEPEVPLAKEPEVEIEEPNVPLAEVPETGDKSLLWGCLTFISGVGLALLALMDKKRKSDEA